MECASSARERVWRKRHEAFQGRSEATPRRAGRWKGRFWGILAACAAAGPSWAAPAGEPLVIGQSLPVIGSHHNAARAMLAGTEAYVQHVNATGGIDGRPLRLVTLDDRNDPALHAENVKRLVTQEKAVAIINCVGDAACRAAADTAGALRVPLVGPISGASSLREPAQPYVFPVRPDYTREAEVLARQMETLGIGRVALVTEPARGSEQPPVLKAALARARIAAEVIEVSSLERPGLERILAALGQGGYGAAILDVGADFHQAVSADALGRRPEWPELMASLGDSAVTLLASNFRGRTVGYTMVVPNPEGASLPLVREFLQHVDRYSDGAAVTFPGLEAYINLRVCVEALRRAAKPVGGQGVAAALESLGTHDLGGFPVSYRSGVPGGSAWVDLGVVSKGGFFLN